MLPPEKHTFDSLWGHEGARRLVPRLLAAGRLPHALLLSGRDAIGKRSLAFAMAKAILSAGIAARGGSISAPAPARAKRTVEPAPEEPEDDGGDLFGDQDDLFGAPEEDAPDLFAEALPAEPEPKPGPPPVPASQAPEALLAAAPVQASATPFLGYDERICRLVEASYPAEYDSSGRQSNVAHSDFYVIEPPGKARSIRVDQVRQLHEVAALPPIEGAFRVVLIFGADTITQEAGNSILKMLEEPPGYLVMILVANQANRVLTTIRSRCAQVPMTPLGRGELIDKLVTEEGLDRELAKVAAALSEGCPGIALAALKGELLKKRREVFSARLQLDRFGQVALPGAASRIAGSGPLEESLWLLLSFARDRLVQALAPRHPELLVHGDAEDLLTVPVDPAVLDAESEKLIAAWRTLDHPFTPNMRAVLQEALWREEG